MRMSDWSSDVCSSDLNASSGSTGCVYAAPMAPATSSTSQQQPKTSAKWPRSSPCRGKQWPEEECRRSPLLSNEDFINSIGRFRPKQPNRQHTAGMAWKADVNSVAASDNRLDNS